MSVVGLAIAFYLSILFGIIIFAGLFIDLVIYTIWLKRRSAWAILWGGISGGMPILAGRVLGIGEVDMIGLLLAAAILLWIPTHILTFNMRHFDDYNKASIPTFASKYGFKNARIIIALSSVGSAIAFCIGCYALGLSWGYFRFLAATAILIIGLSLFGIIKPSDKIDFSIFKFASIFMLLAMIVVALGSMF